MRTMATVWALLGVLLLAGPLQAQSITAEDEKVGQAAMVLKEMMAIPEQRVPPSLLAHAYAVAIIPEVIKGGFIVGARYGQGVLCIRNSSGEWSNPLFITLGGGSVGFQIGVDSTDLILVFKNRVTVDAVLEGKFTLSAAAGAAAGPVGRAAEAGTDPRLQSEILSYSRSRGLFAGVSLEGAVLSVDHDANAKFYRRPNVPPRDVLEGRNVPTVKAAENLRQLLRQYAQ